MRCAVVAKAINSKQRQISADLYYTYFFFFFFTQFWFFSSHSGLSLPLSSLDFSADRIQMIKPSKIR
ncbi:hypothetical protein V6N11_016028 [Hibiscus sabdariffa]|uniref:Uncharacterized protein n=1 Tax=Hibiscus sabdariffa TaxID=183260 RepID=A0ABR2TU32_9ROSI